VSFETLIWVRTQKTGSSTQRSVLRVLADHAGQDHSCYLRTRLIAEETELSESAVRSALASLVQKGFVRVYERYSAAGARRSNRYQILIDGTETPPPDAEDWADVRQQEPEGSPPGAGGGGPAAGGGTHQEQEGFPIKEATSSEASLVKGRASRPRATRVPDDFTPSEEMKKWFVEGGYASLFNGPNEHEKFMDYWRSVPGIRGQKVDWPATWRNWMRTAAERSGRQPGNALVPTSGAPVQYKPSTTDQKVAQTLELGRRLQAMEDAQ